MGLLHASIRRRRWRTRLRKLGGCVVVEPPIPARAVRVCRVPVPTGGDHDRDPLAYPLRPLVSRRRELRAERGIDVDHVTIYRWVQRFTPLFADAARPLRHATGDRWFVDETYVKIAGPWRYLYRAVDQYARSSTCCCPNSVTPPRPALLRPCAASWARARRGDHR